MIDLPVVRHRACGGNGSLVKAWVILDRPPNDPLLRKRETFTSSFPPERRPEVVEAGSVKIFMERGTEVEYKEGSFLTSRQLWWA